ncbi:aminotransferase [Marivivens niveibacter]|uniref:GDP-perosamine synthase n=1 Tax=Marivivens niveibacter TaxID=1930667 RepID=A0A251X2S1_9RHOB|nr:aminotransferase class I/II-fold pyridoxal phosphate-dependent enzyme [Marivivens niveibacter]OUD10463.1 aminotransferase [Marivivens niveibacter]
MFKQNKFVTLSNSNTIKDALAALDETALGMAIRVDDDEKFLCTVTDGDLRRQLLNGGSIDDKLATLPVHTSIKADETTTPRQLLEMLHANGINQVPVVDANGNPTNIVHRADIQNQILLSTPHLGDYEIEFVNEAFRTNWIAPVGPNIDNFEKEICELVGAKYACAVSSGTAGLHLGLVTLGVKPGDTVFVSDFTFIASAAPVMYQHATPVFIDSDPETWNMSPVALRRAFEQAQEAGKMPKAVIVVNLYGQSANMGPILEICDEYGVPILEDAAESLGASYDGRQSGTIGKIGVFSFNGNKIITTSGGGMMVSNDKSLIDKAKKLSTQAREPAVHYEHIELGYNYRMSNILAGIGRGQLRVLNDRIARRREINEIYKSGLSDIDAISFMPEPDWSYSNRWLSCALIDAQNGPKTASALITYLFDHLIEARPLWKPMHLQPVFGDYSVVKHDESQPAVSKSLFETGICLPSGSNMTNEEVENIIQVIRSFWSKN